MLKLEAAIELISYIFQLYESYEIKFHTKISSFTVYKLVHKNGRLRKFNCCREIEFNFFTT